MIKLDDDLLTDLGLDSLPADDKSNLLAHIYETLELRVGERLAEQMTDAQLDEFEQYIKQNDEPGALHWLETNFPNYKLVVSEEFDKLKVEVREYVPQILASAQPQQSTQPAPAMPAAQPQQWQQPEPTQQQYAAPAPVFQPPATQYDSAPAAQPAPSAYDSYAGAQPQQWQPQSPAMAQQPMQPAYQPQQFDPAAAQAMPANGQPQAQPPMPYAPAGNAPGLYAVPDASQPQYGAPLIPQQPTPPSEYGTQHAA